MSFLSFSFPLHMLFLLFNFSFPLHMLFLLFNFSFSSSTHPFHHDRQSLLAFKNEITTDPHGSMADWSPAVPFCNWTAVTCSRRHMDRVVSLDLSDMELRGTISPSLVNLSFLHTLDLSVNALHGYIPRQLGRLFRLRELWLNDNELEGNIPSGLYNCTNLVNLALSYNNLTGSIPRELGSLTHLELLALGANILTGVNLSTDQCPKTQKEEEDMSHVMYANAVASLMYAMVCTRPDITHTVGFLSRYMSSLRKEH